MADINLEQYNGTPFFPATADVGTIADEFLEPTDGPLVTANDNGLDRAPVNRALRRGKDLLLGLRGAIVGDFVGAVKKTVQGWRVARAGGVTHTTAGGVLTVEGPAGPGVAIDAENGDIVASFGSLVGNVNVTAESGALIAGSVAIPRYASLAARLLKFIGTQNGSLDANPPQGTIIANQLRAVNTPKCSAYIRMTAPNTVADFDGYGIASAVRDPGNTGRIIITFAVPFDDAKYAFGAGPVSYIGGCAIPTEVISTRAASSCSVILINSATSAPIDLTATAVSFSVSFDGRQTT